MRSRHTFQLGFFLKILFKSSFLTLISDLNELDSAWQQTQEEPCSQGSDWLRTAFEKCHFIQSFSFPSICPLRAGDRQDAAQHVTLIYGRHLILYCLFCRWTLWRWNQNMMDVSMRRQFSRFRAKRRNQKLKSPFGRNPLMTMQHEWYYFRPWGEREHFLENAEAKATSPPTSTTPRRRLRAHGDKNRPEFWSRVGTFDPVPRETVLWMSPHTSCSPPCPGWVGIKERAVFFLPESAWNSRSLLTGRVEELGKQLVPQIKKRSLSNGHFKTLPIKETLFQHHRLGPSHPRLRLQTFKARVSAAAAAVLTFWYSLNLN